MESSSKLARAVLLFHRGGPWTENDRAAWKELTGEDEASTRTLCDLARRKAAEPETYLIWSNEHFGWWGPLRRGYVSTLSEAGRYSREEALAICTRAIPGTAQRLGMLTEIPVRLTDVLTMQTAHKRHYPKTESWE